MRTAVAALAVAALILPAPAAYARKKPVAAWQVMRSTDPITRASTCAVVASDYYGKMRFTQTGGLYPIVEMNSAYGLLVGVSSGGRYRLPSGDIVWAVDDRPHREIYAANNPGAPQMPGPATDGANAVSSVTAYAMQLAQSGVSTSTMASGGEAREMLTEMLAGRSLLFRLAAATPMMGLPNYQALAAGQITAKGELKPIPLDQSFRDGLTSCGIAW